MKIIYIFFICLLFLQCKHSNKDKLVLDFDSEESIIFQEINYPEMLGVTLQLKLIDSLLLVNQFYGDTLVSIFNTKSNKLEGKIISKGEGPGELIPPLDIQIADGKIYLLSRPLFQLNHLKLDDLFRFKIDLKKDYQMPPKSDCFLPLTNNQFVFSGLWGKRYAYLDLESDSIQIFGDFPDYWSEEKAIPNNAKAMFHQCFFGNHPTENLFVSCSGFILELYQYDSLSRNKLPVLLKQYSLGNYRYSYVSDNTISTKLDKSSDPCATELVCTKNNVYIVMQAKENKRNRDILILDWNFQPVKKLKSDKRITCLAIDEKNKKGYCIIEDPEERLVYFNY